MPARTYRINQAQHKTNIYQVKPTLLVGLGGTGKEVLLRLRQRFVEKYDVVGFPTMAYLWVDTDMQNQNIDGKAITYIDQEARFKESEQVDAQISGVHFQAIFNNPNQHGHIFRWVYPSLAGQGAVINGARKIRPLGRLGFFHAYDTIQRRLNALSSQVLSQKAWQEMQTTYGTQVDAHNGMQIILVCSLAGGTGSGMFLDTTFLVRQMFQNPDIVGYLVLPPVFAPTINDSAEIYANAYAALKELEFYSMRKDLLYGQAQQQLEVSGRITSAHDFVVDWGNAGTPLSIAGPPFNTCYLINNQTMRGGEIGPLHKTHLCDMIAENIFMDFHAETFSARKRSVRSNLDDYLTGELEYEYHNPQGEPIHREVFSCRFSTMGFSMIYVPVDRIRKACAYQLGLDLLNRWLAPHEVSGTLEEEMREHTLPKLELRVGRSADDFRLALERNDDAGQTFWQAIATAWSSREKRVLVERARAAAQPNLREDIERRMQGYAKDMLDKPAEPEYWGAFVRRLELQNRRVFLDRAKGAILTELRGWLKSERIRFDAAVQYLQTLYIILGKHRDFFTRAQERALQTANRLRREIRVLTDMIDDEESGWLVHRFSLRVLVNEVCEKIRQHFEHRVRGLLFNTAAELCQELQSFIGSQQVQKHLDGTETIIRAGLLQDIWGLSEDLGRIRAEVQAKLEAFEDTSEHLIFTNLYQPGMFKKYYQLQRPDGSKAEIDLRLLEQLFCAELGIDGPYDLKAQAERVGMANIHRTLEHFCLERFRHIEVDVDAVKTLYERYQDPIQREQIIDQFVRNGTVWMQPSRRAQVENEIRKNYDDDVEIGLHESGHADYEQVKEMVLNLTQAAGFRSTINTPVDVQKDAIYFYSELAGIPLVYIANIENYKKVYTELAYQGRALHIDSHEEQFADIVIQEGDEIAQTIRVNRVLFVGSILRVVELSGKPGQTMQYSYMEGSGAQPVRRPLGSLYSATRTLRGDQELLRRIENEVTNVRRLLGLDARKKFVTTLMYHTMDGSQAGTEPGPYPPIYLAVGGQVIKKLSPEHSAINQVIEEESALLTGPLNASPEKVKEQAQAQYAFLDQFSEAVTVGTKVHRILLADVLNQRPGGRGGKAPEENRAAAGTGA